MAPLQPTYEHQEDGTINALFEGRVIASADDFDSAVTTATDYLDGLQKQREAHAVIERERKATYIVTPNGLKGQIISRVDGTWGHEITVRFANNEIRRFETTAGLQFSTESPEQPDSYTEALRSVLDRPVVSSREGLTARIAELEAVQREGHDHFASERSPVIQRELNQIMMTAATERREAQDALAYLEQVDAENAAPAAPVYAATEQASMGHQSDWLDVTAREMIAESEAEDMEALLSEGPTKLVSSLDDSAVHHAGTVAEVAANFVMGKTAGFEGKEVEAYRESFVAAAEQARRKELTYRKDAAAEETQTKEASIADVPDEALFI